MRGDISNRQKKKIMHRKQALKDKAKRIAKETIKDLAVASFAAFLYVALEYNNFKKRKQNGYRR
jgi:hypothetical protein